MSFAKITCFYVVFVIFQPKNVIYVSEKRKPKTPLVKKYYTTKGWNGKFYRKILICLYWHSRYCLVTAFAVNMQPRPVSLGVPVFDRQQKKE